MTFKVSVVIPSYNYDAFIANAIDSVLGQQGVDVDVVVVDDGSTDNTLDVLRAYEGRIRLFQQKNGGPARARNFGINQAKAKYITFLDADDWLLENSLFMRCSFFEQHPEYDWVYATWQVANGDGEIIGTSNEYFSHADGDLEGDIFPALIREYSGINTLTPLFKLEDVKKVGGYRTDLKGFEDYDFLLKMARGKAVGLCRDGFAGVQRIHLSHHSSHPEIRYESEIDIRKSYKPDAEAMRHLKVSYRERISNLYNYLAYIYSEEKKTCLALEASLLSILNKPLQYYAFRFAFYTMIGRSDKARDMIKNGVMQMYSRIKKGEKL